MRIHKFNEFEIIEESLPREHTVQQLKMVRKLSKGTDIGDRVSDMNKQGANIQYIQNPVDSGIESYEDYEKHNKKFIPSWNLKHLLSPFNEGKKNKKSNKKTYKRSELTEEMFNEWVKDVRKEFKDAGENIKTSMNLIAVGIRVLDDPKQTDKLRKQWKNNLWKFFENHLAHQNRLLCDTCENPMEVYYDVHCFKCEKPEPKDNELNYFQCVYWLEKNEEDFSKDDLWDYLLKNESIKGNDTYCKLPSTSNDSNMKIFMKHFDTKKTKYFVSW